MQPELPRRVIIAASFAALVASSLASGRIGDGPNQDTHGGDKRFAKFGWKLHQVVSAPVILVGRIARIDGFEEGRKHRVYRVDVDESLKGNLEDSKIYLVEPPTATGRFQPPYLFPAKYLLFLAPANKEAAQEVSQIVGANKQLGVYTVNANWMGAISLDPGWRELTNMRIEADYGPGAIGELTAAVRSVCEYMRATDKEKEKLAEQFRNRGGVYKQFIDDALGQKGQLDREN